MDERENVNDCKRRCVMGNVARKKFECEIKCQQKAPVFQDVRQEYRFKTLHEWPQERTFRLETLDLVLDLRSSLANSGQDLLLLLPQILHYQL